MTYKAFQWPATIDRSAIPVWLGEQWRPAGDVRVVDGTASVNTPHGWETANPGDYIVLTEDGNLHVLYRELFEALTSPTESAEAPLVAQAVDMVTSLGKPPFSSAVLARSANARVAQAEWEAAQSADPEFNALANPPADPHNARVEGSDA
jgi:hypothetical protein